MQQLKVTFHMKSSAPIIHTIQSEGSTAAELKVKIGQRMSQANFANSRILEFDSEGLASSINVGEVAALTVEADVPS